jgi:hypothetical protein
MWPIVLCKKTVTGIVYLAVLENWLLSHGLTDFRENLILQQNGALSHYHRVATRFLNDTLPSPNAWHFGSPDMTPMNFLVWGCIKDQVYIPCLPYTHQELKDRFHQALEFTDTEPYAKHGMNSHIIWMWSGLPVQPALNVCRLRK